MAGLGGVGLGHLRDPRQLMPFALSASSLSRRSEKARASALSPKQQSQKVNLSS